MSSPDLAAAELAQLRQHNEQLQRILARRSAVVVEAFIDGLAFLTQAAVSGDPGARENLRQLISGLDGARSALAGLLVVQGNGHRD